MNSFQAPIKPRFDFWKTRRWLESQRQRVYEQGYCTGAPDRFVGKHGAQVVLVADA